MPRGDAGLQAVLEAAVPFALPLRRRFRGLDSREGVLIKGPSGWGEFAPFDDYSPLAASRWLDSALEAAYGGWPPAVRADVEVNAIIPALDSSEAATLTREAVLELGCRTIKVKVGDRDLADDEARVASVRDVLDTVLGRGRGAIRIDANGAWDVERAVLALRRLGAYELEYVEQPCPTIEELRSLRRRVDVPIAADESVRTSDDPASVRLADIADIAVVKAAPLGGVAATLRIVESLDVPVVVSGSLDSSIGLDVASPRRSSSTTCRSRAASAQVRCWRPMSWTPHACRVTVPSPLVAPCPICPHSWRRATACPTSAPSGGACASSRPGWRARQSTVVIWCSSPRDVAMCDAATP
jgi:O-succinylbenzoate synthase